MIVLNFSCSLISHTAKCSMAIWLATSDLKIIPLQAVVVYGDVIPEFAWRNSGKQKETSYIRRTVFYTPICWHLQLKQK
jgi:hypothetical protein